MPASFSRLTKNAAKCHAERSEASRTGLKSMRGILRFAQNDNVRQFFISLLGADQRVRPPVLKFHHASSDKTFDAGLRLGLLPPNCAQSETARREFDGVRIHYEIS